jgi:mannose-6-phosphate isomerase-like protein (cupin superfamily)|tara:strand:- start:245 stop:598 length:354 start_codon:yes stop_codon:yes gene_type:complete
MIEGKVWGTTEPLIVNSSLEIHRIKIVKGGYCSLHKHQSKCNAFYVISGKLIIERHKKDYKLVDKTTLKGGEFTIVPAGEPHKFESIEKTEALEIYWCELNHNDIIRQDVGGLINYL